MSFFLDEPPPLDYEIPPPLDDKIRDDNDFDLDDIINEDNISTSLELPELELPSDYNVFTAAAIGESDCEPPELPLTSKSKESSSPSTPTEREEEEVSSHCDVAEKKESEKRVDDESISCCAEVASKKEHKSSAEETSEHVIIGERPEPEGSCEFDDSAVTCDDNSNVESRLKCEEEKQIENANTIEDEPSKLNTVDEHNKTEHSTDDDDFSEFQTNRNRDIPEQINESEHVPATTTSTLDFANKSDDDDFDDFNDFESAIPVNRHVELVQQINSQLTLSEDVVFEADFSGFNAFSDSKDEFDDFQDFTSAAGNNAACQLEQANNEDDDDDEFGEFSDFKEAPPPSLSAPEFSSTHSKILMKPSNVNETIDMMFPPESSSRSISDDGESDEPRILKSDNFVNKFNDFDSTVALGYQYTSSKASQILVKSLGIDTRNILVSAQWSSSSNVPRFAANLSFNPIEPLKPTEGGSRPSELNPSVLLPSKTETVPQANFDWNSAGLVNPLDAHKSNYLLDLEQLRVAMANSDKINSSSSLNHAQPSNDPTSLTNQTTDIDELLRQFDSLNTCPTSNYTHTSANSAPSKKPSVLQEESTQPSPSPADANERSDSFVDQEIKQTVETEAKAHASIKSDLSSDPFYQWSNNSNVARTIKLPETHIFTPEKGTSPVSREVVSRDLSPTPLPTLNQPDESIQIKAPVFVREYHDIEYSLEPKKKSADCDAEFDDFQSAEPVSSAAAVPPVDPLTLVPTSILQPLKAEASKEGTEINWPAPGIAAAANQLVDDFAFMDLGQAPAAQSNQIESSIIESNKTSPSTAIYDNFASPLNSVSNENGVLHDDDEFDDFQAAPAIVDEVKRQQNNPITLSPAHLVSQTANTPSTWINSFDDEAEANRIEAAFPKCKVAKASLQQKSATDDSDDWSDFVTAPQNPSKSANNDESDDWSNFVSMPPMMKVPSFAQNPISSQMQSKPNFTSWNQPIKHQYVTHTTSFLTNGASNPPHHGLPAYLNDNNVPTHSMTITDNFNYHLQSFNNQQQQQQQPKRPNGVSTILPDLDFAMPKQNMMNSLSRGGHYETGKK